MVIDRTSIFDTEAEYTTQTVTTAAKSSESVLGSPTS